MKNSIIITFSLLSFFVAHLGCAQTVRTTQSDSLRVSISCEEIMSKEIEKVLFLTLGKDSVLKRFDKDNRLYFTLTLDSLAIIVDVKFRKKDELTIEQREALESNLKNKKLCLINNDPHLSYEEFIRIGKNKYKYVIPYPSYYNQK